MKQVLGIKILEREKLWKGESYFEDIFLFGDFGQIVEGEGFRLGLLEGVRKLVKIVYRFVKINSRFFRVGELEF